ncbi:acyltransferase family protein [Actinomadura craniellae]|uniref:acyltransferase family protein n=1 Tax=Actinomadura craniellae TaxID=2231787 RepID=UPI001313E121|nr:acyltransferase [Actinomadura craniellae]
MTVSPPRTDDRLPAISGHQPALDGVRAVAALAVLVFHVAASIGMLTAKDGASSWLLSRGEIGVPIFFALSGLLLYRPWAAAALGLRPPPGTRNYLWKRALRLLPAYWALVVACMLLYGRDHLGDVLGWFELLTLTYSYDPNPWWNDYLGPKGMGQIWSLTVEAAFYVALPPLAALLARWARRGTDVGDRARRLLWGLAGCAAVSVGYTFFSVYLSGNPAWTGLWLPRYLIWFAIGMALAVVSVWAHADPGPVRRLCRTVAESWGMCWTAAVLLYCVSATPLTGDSRLVTVDPWTTQLHLVLYGLVALFLIAPPALAPAGHPGITRIMGNRVMSYLGKISYSVFLWQFVVIYGWLGLLGRPPFTGTFLIDLPVCAALTVAVAALSFHLIEEPARRIRLGPLPARAGAGWLRTQPFRRGRSTGGDRG